MIPATGYCEWRTESKVRQPYLIHLPGDAPTFEPIAFADIHNRMPVIFKGDALELIQENRSGVLVPYPVSKDVGKVANKGPERIESVQ